MGEGSVLTAYIVEFRSCVSLFHSLVKLRANQEKLLSKHYVALLPVDVSLFAHFEKH